MPQARFVRLAVGSTWAAESVPAFYKKLGIDELFVTSGYAVGSRRPG